MSLSAIMAGGAVAGATAASAAECEGGYPASQCQVELDDNTVRPGEPVSFEADGFDGGEDVDGVVRSTPVKVGTWTANSAGVVSGSFTVPKGLEPGRHSFTLTGQSSGVSKRSFFTVISANAGGNPNTPAGAGGSGGLPVTGSDVGGLIGGGAALVVAGGLLMVASRRRKHVNPAI